jgi:hypothetical protein
MKDDDDVDAIIAEGWALFDEISIKWANLIQPEKRSDDLPPQKPKTEIVGNVIYPSVFKHAD